MTRTPPAVPTTRTASPRSGWRRLPLAIVVALLLVIFVGWVTWPSGKKKAPPLVFATASDLGHVEAQVNSLSSRVAALATKPTPKAAPGGVSATAIRTLDRKVKAIVGDIGRLNESMAVQTDMLDVLGRRLKNIDGGGRETILSPPVRLDIEVEVKSALTDAEAERVFVEFLRKGGAIK